MAFRRRPREEVLTMQLAERITIDPTICHGKPTIRGLRYPVELILELLSAGMSYDEVLADYPDLSARTSSPCSPLLLA